MQDARGIRISHYNIALAVTRTGMLPGVIVGVKKRTREVTLRVGTVKCTISVECMVQL
jgi:hypothetical protein